ncbi:MAG TPA: hypothetical protein VFD49_03025 [Candidatus Dormibacteraeota bacterium]|nr:hypothetical protein [Candidatus Dormibacteraeota bacterium]
MLARLTIEVAALPLEKGWAAWAPEVGLVALGHARREALANLADLLDQYPEIPAEAIQAGQEAAAQLGLVGD